ncbi:MAG: hypothetical protein AVDCRST_MAG16-819, partial [uncultured Frankineae bacterium]
CRAAPRRRASSGPVRSTGRPRATRWSSSGGFRQHPRSVSCPVVTDWSRGGSSWAGVPVDGPRRASARPPSTPWTAWPGRRRRVGRQLPCSQRTSSRSAARCVAASGAPARALRAGARSRRPPCAASTGAGAATRSR